MLSRSFLICCGISNAICRALYNMSSDLCLIPYLISASKNSIAPVWIEDMGKLCCIDCIAGLTTVIHREQVLPLDLLLLTPAFLSSIDTMIIVVLKSSDK